MACPIAVAISFVVCASLTGDAAWVVKQEGEFCTLDDEENWHSAKESSTLEECEAACEGFPYLDWLHPNWPNQKLWDPCRCHKSCVKTGAFSYSTIYANDQVTLAPTPAARTPSAQTNSTVKHKVGSTCIQNAVVGQCLELGCFANHGHATCQGLQCICDEGYCSVDSWHCIKAYAGGNSTPSPTPPVAQLASEVVENDQAVHMTVIMMFAGGTIAIVGAFFAVHRGRLTDQIQQRPLLA